MGGPIRHSSAAYLGAHCGAVSLRSVHPTAIGLRPPSFLLRAVTDPPKKDWRTVRGIAAPPSSRRLIRAVSCCRRELSGSPVAIRSFKCCGRRPSGPPAEPAGKDMMASRTSRLVACRCAAPAAGVGLDRLSAGVSGCRIRSLLRFIVSTWASVSVEHRTRMAPLTLPSSSFPAARLAISSSSFLAAGTRVAAFGSFQIGNSQATAQ